MRSRISLNIHAIRTRSQVQVSPVRKDKYNKKVRRSINLPVGPGSSRSIYHHQFPRSTISSYSTNSTSSMRDSERLHRLSGHFSRHLHSMNTSHMRPEDPYLSYHDVLLTKEDIDTLKDDWLTDNIISFYEEYLEHETLEKHKDANVVLLRPSMTLMLFLSKDPLSLKEALPPFEGVSHIFLPINDNTDIERAEGGSHWSLLVVSTTDKTAFHYDSLCSANDREARAVTNNMSKLLGYSLRYMDLEDAPQQSNSSDCGVFVCMIMANLLITRLLTKQKGERVSMSMRGKNMDARHGRRHMLKLIEEFRIEGERRRSASGSPHPGSKDDDHATSGNRSKSNSRSPPRIE